MMKVLNGIDCTEKWLPLVKGQRTGLITNMSGVTKSLVPNYVILNELCKLQKLFSPEHGLFGAAQAGCKIESEERELITNTPVISLYGEKKAPDDEMLEGIDMLLFDLQDVGARFYTYLYTMTRSMKSAARAKIPFVVFDRMNPISLNKIEGEILDEANSSFIGEYAVPTRYGMTIGEFAKYINAKENIGVDLHIIPCDGLTRELYHRDTDLPWVAPSPNMPTTDTALVYVGTCIFESTKQASEGRGTTQPFEFIGAPNYDGRALADEMNRQKLDGVIFRPLGFTPTFSKFKGEFCSGVQLHVMDRDAFSPFAAGVKLVETVRNMYGTEFDEKSSKRIFGTGRLFDGVDSDVIIKDCLKTSEKFRKATSPYYIYK